MAAQGNTGVRMVSSGPTFELWHSAKGAMRLDWTKRGAVRIIVEGHGVGDYGPLAVRRFDDAYRAVKRVNIFFDFWDMPSYDPELRTATQGWGVKHLKDMEAVYLTTQSKLVAMGATVGNLALGGIVKVLKRIEFDKECAKQGIPVNPNMRAID